MGNKFRLTWLFLLISSSLLAQKELDLEQELSFFDRVYTGGGLSMQFGDFTFVEVSPSAGYMITNMFSAGVGFTYRYVKIKQLNFDTNVYGWRVFARHNLGQQFFLYTEYENLSYEFFIADGTTREWVSGLFAGGGLQQPIGNGGVYFVITALYNFAYDSIKSPYNSPWVFRVGFTI